MKQKTAWFSLSDGNVRCMRGVTVSALCALSFGLLGANAVRADDLSKLSPDLNVAVNTARVKQATVNRARIGVVAGAVTATSKPVSLRVIVRTTTGVARFSSAARARLGRTVSRVERTFVQAGSYVVEATPDQIAALTRDPNVASLSPDRPVASSAASLDINRRATGADVPGANFGALASQVNATVTGKGVGVAVIDSGVAPVADLQGRIAGFKDFVNGRTAAYDDYGHGTHVAGVIAGTGASSSGSEATRTFKGVAPSAKIIGVKVLDGEGRGNISDVIAALDWCIANKKKYNLKVINLSLGGGVFESYKTDPLCQAAEKAVASGITVVTSAGNWGGVYGGVGCPGNDPNLITVGASRSRGTAIRSDDAIASFSSRGPTRFDMTAKPDLVAPGNSIVSLRSPGSWIDTQHPEVQVPTSAYLTDPSDDDETAYVSLSGTSMASPSVAGAAALLAQVNPTLTPNGVKAALMLSAQLLKGFDPVTNKTAVYDPMTQGAGLLNVPGSVELAANMSRQRGLSFIPSLQSTIAGETFSWALQTIPTLLLRPLSTGREFSLLTLEPGAWASPYLWGNNLAWGGTTGTLTEGRQVIWGTQAIWGTRGFAGDGDAVWGNNIVWGGTTGGFIPDVPDIIWANNIVWGGTTGGLTDLPTPLDPEVKQVIWGTRGIIESNNIVWGGTTGGFTSGDTIWDVKFVGANNIVWGGTTGGLSEGRQVIWGTQAIWGTRGVVGSDPGEDLTVSNP